MSCQFPSLMCAWLAVITTTAPRWTPLSEPLQESTTEDGSSTARAEVAIPPPAGLPRAAAGTWDAFFDPTGIELRVATLDPAARAALDRGEKAYRAVDYPGAVAALHEALRQSPDLPPAWLVLGTTYFRLQRYSDARDAFERFLAVAPGEAWRTQGLAHSYYSLGSYQAAKAHYELVLERVPDSQEARRGLALSEWRLGNDAVALSLLAELSRAAPRRFEAQLWYGRVLFDTGEVEAALPVARLASQLSDHDPRGWFLLLECLWELGREEEAAKVEIVWRDRDVLAQARRRVSADLRIRPRDWLLLRRAVELGLEAGDGDEVKALLPRLLRARPADVEPLSVRLFALESLERLGENDAARAVARGIEGAHADDVEAWRALEGFYARLGDVNAQARAGERRRRLGG